MPLASAKPLEGESNPRGLSNDATITALDMVGNAPNFDWNTLGTALLLHFRNG